jgi:hypothetical protein
MKRILFSLTVGLMAAGCGGSQESSSAPAPSNANPAPVVAASEIKPAPEAPSPSISPTKATPKKNDEPPGLVLPDDDVEVGGKAPELPIR